MVRGKYLKSFRDFERVEQLIIEKELREKKIEEAYRVSHAGLTMLVQKQIEQGQSLEQALATVFENERVQKLYSQLQEDRVRAKVKRLIRIEFYQKRKSEEKDMDDSDCR